MVLRFMLRVRASTLFTLLDHYHRVEFLVMLCLICLLQYLATVFFLAFHQSFLALLQMFLIPI